MQRKNTILKNHSYNIWQGTNGSWYTYLPEEQGRRLVKRKKLDELENIIVKFYRERNEIITVQNVFEDWNNHRLSMNQISQATFARNVDVFDRHFSIFGKKNIKRITASQIETFLEKEICEKKLTRKAFSSLKGLLKGIMKRAKRTDLISMDVETVFREMDFTEIGFREVVKEDYEEIFNDEEIDLIMEYILDNLDLHNIGILLMFATGIRVGELVTLKAEDFVDHTLRIRRTETRYRVKEGKYDYKVKNFPKTRAGVRNIVFSEQFFWLEDLCKAISQNREYLFMDEQGKRMSTNCFRRRMTRICDKLHIAHRSPHKIRKTYGSILLDNMIDNNFVIQQMGHCDITTTETKYHRNRKSTNKKVELLTQIPEFQHMYKNMKEIASNRG